MDKSLPLPPLPPRSTGSGSLSGSYVDVSPPGPAFAPTASPAETPADTASASAAGAAGASPAADNDEQWASSSNESSNARVSRKTVKKEYRVGSPRSPQKAPRGLVYASGYTATGTGSPTRRRKDSSNNVNKLLAPPRSGSSNGHRDAARESKATRTRSRETKDGRPWTAQLWTLLWPIRLLVSLVANLLGVVINPMQQAIFVFCLLLLTLSSVYFLLLPSFKQIAGLLLPSSLISVLGLPVTSFKYIQDSPLTEYYCSVVGIGCSPEHIPIGRLARTVSEQAVQAQDIFQSVVALGRPDKLALHHVEIWELAVAVKATSDLEGKDALASELKELGDYTRNVKDAMISLNAKGINAFTWLMHEFTRVEKTIELLHTRSGRYTAQDVSRQLDGLFDRLANDLTELLKAIENVLPMASQASEKGEGVMYTLSQEHARLTKAKEDVPLWRRLKDTQSFAGRQLRRDLKLCGDSVVDLASTRHALEDARAFLIGYRDQVSYFRASAVGFHLADHGLEPEDEVEALRNVMMNFQTAVQDAKRIGMGKLGSGLEELD